MRSQPFDTDPLSRLPSYPLQTEKAYETAKAAAKEMKERGDLDQASLAWFAELMNQLDAYEDRMNVQGDPLRPPLV